MNRKPSGFDERLSHSIELLKKSEKLALRYDTQDGFFLAFSGGKSYTRWYADKFLQQKIEFDY